MASRTAEDYLHLSVIFYTLVVLYQFNNPCSIYSRSSHLRTMSLLICHTIIGNFLSWTKHEVSNFENNTPRTTIQTSLMNLTLILGLTAAESLVRTLTIPRQRGVYSDQLCPSACASVCVCASVRKLFLCDMICQKL